jgi:hypothetical protein
VFPPDIYGLLQTLSSSGFFERSLLVGSWVMSIYQELYNVDYVLKTLDVDFAVHVAHQFKDNKADLEKLISELGFSDFISAQGLQKFTAGGYEIEFVAHRQGGRKDNVVVVKEWNITAQPLPFINILLEFSELAKIDDFFIRFPIPESFFLHKLIIAQKRRSEAKQAKDLDQCKILKEIINHDQLNQIIKSQKMSKETRRCIRSSSEAIEFPLHEYDI